MFMLTFFGWELQKMLLVLTTLLSIEAIYLALFIQMSVNKTSKSLAEVEKDIDVIQAEDKKDEQLDREVSSTLRSIQQRLTDLQQDIAWLQEMEPARQITEYTNSTQEKK